jgi:hypothetical protein
MRPSLMEDMHAGAVFSQLVVNTFRYLVISGFSCCPTCPGPPPLCALSTFDSPSKIPESKCIEIDILRLRIPKRLANLLAPALL